MLRGRLVGSLAFVLGLYLNSREHSSYVVTFSF